MSDDITTIGIEDSFPISTTFDIPPFVVDRTLGLCWGVVVRSVGTVKGFTGGFRSMRRGEVPQYTELVDQSRHHALQRLIAHARELDAGAVLGVRFDSTELAGNLAEIVAYGTAVTLRRP